jgi:hypothetical protein
MNFSTDVFSKYELDTEMMVTDLLIMALIVGTVLLIRVAFCWFVRSSAILSEIRALRVDVADIKRCCQLSSGRNTKQIAGRSRTRLWARP